MNTIIRLVFAVSMCVLLLAVAVIGSLFIDQTDGDVLRLLNAPGPVERWATLQIERNPNQDSPLIREARAYALLLDPPAPPVVAEPKVPVIKEPSPPVIQPQRSGPKFKVYATSVYTADSSRSMALIEEPKLLLLDEITAGMSGEECNEMVEMAKKIRDRGVTIVLIEHNMRVAMALSDRILVLNFGKKIAEGTPQEVTTNETVLEAYLGKEEY